MSKRAEARVLCRSHSVTFGGFLGLYQYVAQLEMIGNPGWAMLWAHLPVPGLVPMGQVLLSCESRGSSTGLQAVVSARLGTEQTLSCKR